jgi:predicted ester cyclase
VVLTVKDNYQGDRVMSDANKRAVAKAIDEIWNKGNLGYVDDIVGPSYVGHMPGGFDIRGPDGFRSAIGGFRKGISDVKMSIHRQVSEDDLVASHLSWTGRHTGTLNLMGRDIPATNRLIGTSSASIVRFRDDKIVEEWVYWDESNFMSKLS